LLIAALVAVKKMNYLLHKRLMMTALVLSVVFLVSYIAHHLLAGEARFGDANHDGFVSEEEKLLVSSTAGVSIILYLAHISYWQH
jgi:putative membrane protein